MYYSEHATVNFTTPTTHKSRRCGTLVIHFFLLPSTKPFQKRMLSLLSSRKIHDLLFLIVFFLSFRDSDTTCRPTLFSAFTFNGSRRSDTGGASHFEAMQAGQPLLPHILMKNLNYTCFFIIRTISQTSDRNTLSFYYKHLKVVCSGSATIGRNDHGNRSRVFWRRSMRSMGSQTRKSSDHMRIAAIYCMRSELPSSSEKYPIVHTNTANLFCFQFLIYTCNF